MFHKQEPLLKRIQRRATVLNDRGSADLLFAHSKDCEDYKLAHMSGKRLQSLSLMMLLAARIKYADLNWPRQGGNLLAPLTGGLEACHTPGLVD